MASPSTNQGSGSQPTNSITGKIVYDTNDPTTGKPTQKPIQGVSVKLSDPKGHDYPSIETDKDGIFTFPPPLKSSSSQVVLNRGDEWIVTLNERIETATSGITIQDEEPGLKLKLIEPTLASIHVSVNPGSNSLGSIEYEAQGSSVRGILYFDKDNLAKPDSNPRFINAPVKLVPIPIQSEHPVQTTQTDEQGNYLFSALTSGKYRLEVDLTLEGAKFGVEEGTYQLVDEKRKAFLLGLSNEHIEDIGYKALHGTIHGIVFLDKDGNGKHFNHEPGIQRVPVELVDEAEGANIRRDETGRGGGYSLNAPPGTYSLRFATTFVQNGKKLTITTAKTQQVTILAGQTIEAPPTGYQPEAHGVTGRVIFEDGTPVVKLIVTLHDENDKEVDRTQTKEGGYFAFDTGREGKFHVKFPDAPFNGQLLTPQIRDAEVKSIRNLPDTIYRLTSGDTGDATIVTPTSGSIQEAVSDIASYMPTAQEVTGPMVRTGAYGPPGAPAPLRQVVEGALREVLGNKLKNENSQVFLASLTRAFTLEQVEGRTTYKWMPRTYAVQTELGGGISGAQASIYHRAKVALDDTLPLLDGLYPLSPDFDKQEVEAARAIVRTEFIELVNELGVEGGPRVQRVDDLFRLLDIKLKDLETVFGLTPERVITIEEEQNLTNFLVIRDYVQGLSVAWSGASGFRKQFTGTDPRFLGTQLVLLSRALSVVAESVDESYLAMDSVFLGSAERQTVRIDFPTKVRIDGKEEPILKDGSTPPSMFVEELLSWVARFATDEGPTLIQDGGKRGVQAIQPTADRLRRFVLGAAQTTKVAHVSFSRTRVRRALSELADQLGHIDRLARELLGQNGLIQQQ